MQVSQSTTVDGGALTIEAGGRVSAALLTVAKDAQLHGLGDGALNGTRELRVNSGAELRLDGAQAMSTVSSLALSGLYSGSGRLAADTASLDGGHVFAQLNAGTLSSNGDADITARVSATQPVQVQSGRLVVRDGGVLDAARVQVANGTLSVQLGGRLADDGGGSQADNGTAVQVSGQGVLALDIDQTIRSLALSGRVKGAGCADHVGCDNGHRWDGGNRVARAGGHDQRRQPGVCGAGCRTGHRGGWRYAHPGLRWKLGWQQGEHFEGAPCSPPPRASCQAMPTWWWPATAR